MNQSLGWFFCIVLTAATEGLLGRVDRRLVAIAGLHEEIVGYVALHVVILQVIDHEHGARTSSAASGGAGLSV